MKTGVNVHHRHLKLYLGLIICVCIVTIFISLSSNEIQYIHASMEGRYVVTINETPHIEQIAQNLNKNKTIKVASKATAEVGLPILQPRFNGRLGNQMFVYAATYALAVKYNMSVYIGKHQMTKLFNLDQTVLTGKSCSNWLTVNSPCCDYDPTLAQRIDRTQCQKVGSYFQSWKFFQDVEDRVRKQFTFQRHITKPSHEKLLFIKQTYMNKRKETAVSNSTRGSSNVTFVGIHARRGDYMSTSSKRQGRITPDKGYYKSAMDYFRKKFSNVLFLAASDSPDWLKSFLKSPDVVVLQGNKPEVDLYLLSMCNHSIISVGTFSWWAGYLAGGTTIYFTNKMINGTMMSKSHKRYLTDFIYRGWIPMD